MKTLNIFVVLIFFLSSCKSDPEVVDPPKTALLKAKPWYLHEQTVKDEPLPVINEIKLTFTNDVMGILGPSGYHEWNWNWKDFNEETDVIVLIRPTTIGETTREWEVVSLTSEVFSTFYYLGPDSSEYIAKYLHTPKD